MFDEQDRQDLIEILDEEYKEAFELLQHGRAIPREMSHNKERVGITITFRKLKPVKADYGEDNSPN